ncbi:fasciclin-like arabinogalactan protein 7 [Rhododendron vialii]|uniref:fasciclin-like arabinogalactan protein 7 n=1 Tax=Rhododendron vialii TaxID=182163 RepID=UPI002660342F|nr:fasciclin-like arabinogalactan protein 7 [Rhododendron vialii]
MMDFTLMFFIVTITLVLNFSPSAYSETFVNVTDILSSPNVHLLTFLSLLQTENVIEILQTQANTQTGLTLFAPNDAAFASDNVPWGNLSLAQLQSLILSHALPQYFGDTSSDINTLCQLSPVTTMAGGQYTLNITFVSDTLYVNVSSSSSAQVLTAVNLTTYPTEVYQIDKVLMPEAIFGTNSPPAPPPTPATANATSVWTNSTPPYTPHHSMFASLL